MKLYFATFQTQDSDNKPSIRSHTALIAEQVEIRSNESRRKIYSGLTPRQSAVKVSPSLFTNRAKRYDIDDLYLLSSTAGNNPETFINSHYGYDTLSLIHI